MNDESILTINGGSSSIKFSVYHAGDSLVRGLTGNVDRIGYDEVRLTFCRQQCDEPETLDVVAPDYASAVTFLLDWLDSKQIMADVKAIGHRIVHGMQRSQPERVTQELLDELHRITPFAPEHLPGDLTLIEAFPERHSGLPQFVCFDTAFHRTMPRIATLLPIPRRYASKGVQRYGFHGLSDAYLMQELQQLRDRAATDGRVILARRANHSDRRRKHDC